MTVRQVGVLVRYVVREFVRRRTFLAVVLLSGAFLALYAFGLWQLDRHDAFAAGRPADTIADVDERVVVAATLLGLALFGVQFLGAVVAIFLTMSSVSGDAERGILQPLLVRPLRRTTLLGARIAGAALLTGGYVVLMAGGCMVLLHAFSGWWPSTMIAPIAQLALGAVVLVTLGTIVSVRLSAMATGVVTFMLFGVGLLAGLLGQIGEALRQPSLRSAGDWVSWALPFEALYQSALAGTVSGLGGATRFVVQLGPFGGSRDAGPWLWPFAVAWIAVGTVLAAWSLRRRDL